MHPQYVQTTAQNSSNSPEIIGMKIILVGGWATPLKNMKVNWDDEIPNSHGTIKNGNQTTIPSFGEFP